MEESFGISYPLKIPLKTFCFKVLYVSILLLTKITYEVNSLSIL